MDNFSKNFRQISVLDDLCSCLNERLIAHKRPVIFVYLSFVMLDPNANYENEIIFRNTTILCAM
jgi:hypothetical protein